MRDIFGQVLFPPLLGVALLLIGWSYGRSIRGRRPFTPAMKAITAYGVFFVVGTTYFMAWGPELGSILGVAPNRAWIVPSLPWGLTLGYIAWTKRRQHTATVAKNPPESTRASLAESLPLVGLLVCLIGAAVEWEFVARGQGHLLIALLWMVGVAAAIGLARRNRRATVVTALRAFLGLLVVGALAQWSLPGLIAAGATAVVLLLLEKLWKKKPPTVDLEALVSHFTEPTQPPSKRC